jgi:hypothetical protein
MFVLILCRIQPIVVLINQLILEWNVTSLTISRSMPIESVFNSLDRVLGPAHSDFIITKNLTLMDKRNFSWKILCLFQLSPLPAHKEKSTSSSDLSPSGKQFFSDRNLVVLTECVRKAGLKIAPLLDRIFFEFLSCLESGILPKSSGGAMGRTSTFTRIQDGRALPSTIMWRVGPSDFGLCLYSSWHAAECIGAAVRVPTESSEAISH